MKKLSLFSAVLVLCLALFAGCAREGAVISSGVPESFEGFPIALTTAGLLALAFMGFSGMSIA